MEGKWTDLPEAGVSYWLPHEPCPIVGLLNCWGHPIDQTAVEHYVADVLMELSKDWKDPNLGFASRAAAMGEIINVIATVGQTQRPTYRTFRAEWQKRFPNYVFGGRGRPEAGYDGF